MRRPQAYRFLSLLVCLTRRTLVKIRTDGLQSMRKMSVALGVSTSASFFYARESPFSFVDPLVFSASFVASQSTNPEVGKGIIRRLRDEGFVRALYYGNGSTIKGHEPVEGKKIDKMFLDYFKPEQVWIYKSGTVNFLKRRTRDLPGLEIILLIMVCPRVLFSSAPTRSISAQEQENR